MIECCMGGALDENCDFCSERPQGGPNVAQEVVQTSSGILDEAAKVVNGDRNHHYGHPSDNHGCTAAMWSAYLSRKYRAPITLDAEDVCWLNVLQKVSRQANRPKDDNLIDAVGYILNIEMIHERE